MVGGYSINEETCICLFLQTLALLALLTSAFLPIFYIIGLTFYLSLKLYDFCSNVLKKRKEKFSTNPPYKE